MTIAPNPSAQPEEYLPKIKELLTTIQSSENTALQRAIACGQLLASAKEALSQINAKLPKSKQISWGGWLEESLTEFKFKRSTADVYIRLYEERDLIKEKGCKSISEARAVLPSERGGGGGNNDDNDDDDADSDDSNPVAELSDKDREQVALVTSFALTVQRNSTTNSLASWTIRSCSSFISCSGSGSPNRRLLRP